MKTGRPTKYNKKILRKTQKYLDTHRDGYYEPRTYFTKTGKEKTKYVFNPNMPTIEELSLFLNINRSTIYDWERKHQDFSDIVGSIRVVYKNKLVRYGLTGLIRENMALFLYKKVLRENKKTLCKVLI